MPRYFFDICDDEILVHDVRGAVLDNAHAALEEALTLLPLLAASKCDGHKHRFVALVTNEDKQTIGRAVLDLDMMPQYGSPDQTTVGPQVTSLAGL